MGDFIAGARFLLGGFSLINQPGVRRFAYIPILINTLLFSAAMFTLTVLLPTPPFPDATAMVFRTGI